MRVLSIFVATLLLYSADGFFWQFSSFVSTGIFKQSEKLNNNKGRYPKICPKHCNCYKFVRDEYNTENIFFVKVKCYMNGLKRVSNWKILPKIIDLSNNNIEKLPANHFSKFYNLSMLLLNNNKINKIRNHSFEGLGNLYHLDLTSNNINSIPTKSFHPIRKLTELSLDHNNIKEIKDFSFDVLNKLKTLFLEYNKIKKIGKLSFSGLNNLEKLSLANNQIKSIEEFSFNGLNHLTFLWLNHNEMENIETFLFDGLNSLEMLSMTHNKLRAIGELSFDSFTELMFLHLYGNKISYIHKRAFKNQTSLLGLYMGNNEIRFISPTTFNPLKQLVHLDISNNNLTALSYRIFLRLENIEKVRLDNNPIVYDCNHWLNVIKFKQKERKDYDVFELWQDFAVNITNCTVSPQIEIQPHNAEVFLGDKIRLNCGTIGFPFPEITWNYNGKPLQVDNRVRILSDGRLRIKSTMEKDAGEYQCIATNSVGSASSRQVTLSIKEGEVLEGSADE